MARKELVVETRKVIGKKVARLRREGLLPANVYGHGVPSVALQLDAEAFEKTLRASAANEVMDLKISGERNARPVVIQHVQRHPLTSAILHADFYQVSLREKMRAEVPLVVVGSSEAVDTYNGVLLMSLETLHVEALPLDLPPHIEVDITPLKELESSLHVRDIPVPSNVTVLNDPDVVVVKVAAPRIAEELEAEEAAAEEAAPGEAAEASSEEESS